MAVISEGVVKVREGKKWKKRWCKLEKVLSDSYGPHQKSNKRDVTHLTLKVYKLVRSPPHIHPVEHEDEDVDVCLGVGGGGVAWHELKYVTDLGYISGLQIYPDEVDGEGDAMALVGSLEVVTLALASRRELLEWEVKIRNNTPEERTFKAQIEHRPSKSRVPAHGMITLHVQNQAFTITSGLPPKVCGLWLLRDLKRYGTRDGKFYFYADENLPASLSRLYVLQPSLPYDLEMAFKLASTDHLAQYKRNSVASRPDVSSQAFSRRKNASTKELSAKPPSRHSFSSSQTSSSPGTTPPTVSPSPALSRVLSDHAIIITAGDGRYRTMSVGDHTSPPVVEQHVRHVSVTTRQSGASPTAPHLSPSKSTPSFNPLRSQGTSPTSAEPINQHPLVTNPHSVPLVIDTTIAVADYIPMTPPKLDDIPLTPPTSHYTTMTPTTSHYTPPTSPTSHYTPMTPTTSHYTPMTPTTSHYTPMTPPTSDYTLMTPPTSDYTLMTPPTSHYTPMTPPTSNVCIATSTSATFSYNSSSSSNDYLSMSPSSDTTTHHQQPDSQPGYMSMYSTQPASHPAYMSMSPTQPASHPAYMSMSPTQPHSQPAYMSMSHPPPTSQPGYMSMSPTLPASQPAYMSMSPTSLASQPGYMSMSPTPSSMSPTQPHSQPAYMSMSHPPPTSQPAYMSMSPTSTSMSPTPTSMSPTSPASQFGCLLMLPENYTASSAMSPELSTGSVVKMDPCDENSRERDKPSASMTRKSSLVKKLFRPKSSSAPGRFTRSVSDHFSVAPSCSHQAVAHHRRYSSISEGVTTADGSVSASFLRRTLRSLSLKFKSSGDLKERDVNVGVVSDAESVRDTSAQRDPENQPEQSQIPKSS